MEDEVILFTALMVLVGWVLWLMMRRYQLQHHERIQRLEVQRELVKKFSSVPEFVDFVKSDEGKQIFTEPESGAHVKVIRYVTASVLLILVGITIMINAYSYRFETDSNYVSKAQDLYYWGSLAVAIGIGLVINAFITVRLAKSWNLMENGK